MSTKLKLLELFNSNPSQYISGQELAKALGVSRNSVWKAIKTLQGEGFEIQSKPATGYRLLQKNDILSADIINEALQFPCKVHILDEVDSTNNYAKSLSASPCPNVVIANSQTAGRGRLGRPFYSPHSKGLYMTIAFEPNFSLDQSMLITVISALAVCLSFEETVGLGPKIKWVNDVYLQDKKVCGILTEAETNFETGHISRIILGVGVNCFEQNFPEELKERAAYIGSAPKEFTRSQLAASIINNFFDLLQNFDRKKILRQYKSRSMILGEQILLYGTSYGAMPEHGGRGVKARAIDIDENGGLVVEYLEGRNARQMDTINSGEVTVRKG